MRKVISFIVALCLVCCTCTALAGEFLPSISSVYGVYMPSLSFTLRRFGAEKILPDGSRLVTYTEVSEVDYDTFGDYLEEYGCTLLEYGPGDNGYRFVLEKDGYSFIFEYDNVTAIAIMNYPADCIEDLSWAQEIYDNAMSLLEQEEYIAATTMLEEIKDYKDVTAILADYEDEVAEEVARLERWKPYTTIGNYVFYGHYPQTKSGNDSTPIEWLVLDYDSKNHKVLLISRYGLDTVQYNTTREDMSWEKSSIRKWLNETFVNKAFSKQEREYILVTEVKNNSCKVRNYSKFTIGGNSTQDRVFLLSYDEAHGYLNVGAEVWPDERVVIAPTPYALNRGVYVGTGSTTKDGQKAGEWWLRTIGEEANCAFYVTSVGGSPIDDYVNTKHYMVRPAFWLDLSGI